MISCVTTKPPGEVVRRCSVKKMYLEILQNSHGNICTWVFIKKTSLKKRLWHRCFPANFEKFLKTPFLIEHLRWLFLNFTNITFTQYEFVISFKTITWEKLVPLVVIRCHSFLFAVTRCTTSFHSMCDSSVSYKRSFLYCFTEPKSL